MASSSYVPPRVVKLRKDLLYRLRWPIFAPLSDIQISTGPISITFNEPSKNILSQDTSQTTLIPLFESPLANESIATPPLSRIDEIRIAECENKQDYHEQHDDFGYKAPTPLTIANPNGKPITLGQFVTEVQEYYNTNIAAVKRIKAETYGRLNESGGRTVTYGELYLPDDVGFWFHRQFATDREGKVRVSVEVQVEGEAWTRNGMNRFWEMQLRTAEVNERGVETM
jgi:hypothetical protein